MIMMILIIAEWIQQDFGQIQQSRIKQSQNPHGEDGNNSQISISGSKKQGFHGEKTVPTTEKHPNVVLDRI